MKTTITLALAALLALAAHTPAQTADDVWQMLVEAEVALTIEDDVERAEALVAKADARAADFADDAQHERIVERVAELRVMIEQAREDDAEPSLDEWILAHLAKRDVRSVRDAGSGVTRRLAEMLSARAFADPSLESYAIFVFTQVDPSAAVELGKALLDRDTAGDVHLAARLAVARISAAGVSVGLRDGRIRWVDPRWRDLLVALLAHVDASDVGAADVVAEAVERVIEVDLVDTVLVDALVAALPRLPDQRAKLTGRTLANTPDELAAVDAALLEIGTPDETSFAAERLAFRDDATPLAAYDTHPDPRVRREVARSITRRKTARGASLVPPYTARQREALARLVTDADVATRALATRGATDAPDALTRERWLDLARDPQLDVRVEVAQFPYGHEWTRDVLVTVIEASDEPAVALAVDSRLRGNALHVAPLDVIDARLHHPTQPMSATSPPYVSDARDRFVRDIPHFIRWYLEGDEERARRYLDLATNVRNFLARTSGFEGLAPADLEAFQRKVWSASDGVRTAVDLAAHPRAALHLALDDSLPWSWRWQAIDALKEQNVRRDDQGVFRYSEAVSPAERAALFTSIVTDPASAGAPGAAESLSWLLRGTPSNELILDAWTNDGPPEHPLLAASLWVDWGEPRSVELAERIIALGDAVSLHKRFGAVSALIHAEAAPDALVDEVLLSPHAEDLDTVVTWVAQQDDAGRFASVRALLTGEAPRVGPTFDERTRDLVSALGWSGTRAALDLLLTAAESGPSRSLREDALRNARSIRQHLDDVERFNAEAATPATRESARSELVVLLDSGSPAQRAEAARGLATLGAVEELPRLIRLLDDDDAQVVSAVREAIDRLHASGDG